MESVKLIECPRDAWQGLPRVIPSSAKAEYLRRLIDAGFQHLDAASFVSPKAVPQMADSEEVLAQLGSHEGVEVIGIVVNEKGAERAIATKAVNTLGYPCSVSETFLRRNQNQSLGENQAGLAGIGAMARDAGLNVVAYISMAFGNPYGDLWNGDQVAEMAATLAATGIGAVSLADTVGKASPELIHAIVTAVLGKDLPCEIGVHMHSTRAAAADKILAAYDAGCRRFDSAIGGLGGCPFAQDDLVGNIPTEEVVAALAQRGVELAMTETIGPVLEANRAITRQFATC
ncbi:MAG TPA: hydroxymethylglutaryl-CoA lyase [Chthoniobacterales bacterium]|nr:hydroxymethylglutaryl-CoA lyase [Chthoniobacterales bacterium]